MNLIEEETKIQINIFNFQFSPFLISKTLIFLKTQKAMATKL